ncbi:MAG TPA: alpha-amylase family glycosyl hydrolase [Jatrophihabitans sp.]|jgi:cyclomaltodextrinase|uniref:alpha-amylase family glycosyl hydrolase n=1 Tax=Jatrophihabitans sp. TaxID=1932789 RepID=UPI002E071BA9|nr:alpha-amylase family glycosyl hydrolase [Jatrophihabitans sp.]
MDSSAPEATPGPRAAPGWVEHVIWWHVYPLGFVGADTSGEDRTPGGGFDHLSGWLDHAVELGVNGLALGPIFQSGSHGYDTLDHFAVDPRLGDADGFRRLVDAAHRNGVRILLDGVFNHVGRGFPGVREAELEQGGSRDGWFRRDRDGRLATFEGHAKLVALDHGDPAVADHVRCVMRHWLDLGVDGWRLDAAYAVPPSFWHAVLPPVRESHPDAYFVGEVLHGDYADYVRRSGIDSVTQYELWKAIWSALDSRNFFELDWTLRRHNDLLDTFVPYTFVGNHDVTRLASQISDPRHHPHALALLMVLGGTPSIYYGDEQGLRAVKEDRIGGDDAVRPAFPATPLPLENAAAEVFRLHQQLIGLRRRHPWLHQARSETLLLRNEALVLRVHAADDLILALNLDETALRVEGTSAGELLAGTAHRSNGGWTVPAHGWAVLG